MVMLRISNMQQDSGSNIVMSNMNDMIQAILIILKLIVTLINF